MNEWELLAGLQALSIFIFIRMDEGEREWNNLDVLLQSTVIVLSQQLAFHDLSGKTSSASDKSGSEREWETWIFGESRRRLVFLFFSRNLSTDSSYLPHRRYQRSAHERSN